MFNRVHQSLVEEVCANQAADILATGLIMTHSASSALDRRLAPRIQTRFAAELLSGTVLGPGRVRDLAGSGCGVDIQSADPDLPSKLGEGGILHFPALELGSPATILPVVLRNVRSEGPSVLYGLEFRPLLPNQMRKLLAVMDVMVQEKAEEGP